MSSLPSRKEQVYSCKIWSLQFQLLWRSAWRKQVLRWRHFRQQLWVSGTPLARKHWPPSTSPHPSSRATSFEWQRFGFDEKHLHLSILFEISMYFLLWSVQGFTDHCVGFRVRAVERTYSWIHLFSLLLYEARDVLQHAWDLGLYCFMFLLTWVLVFAPIYYRFLVAWIARTYSS